MCKIAKVLIILIMLVPQLICCASFENRIFDEFPGADKLSEMSISYNKNNILHWNVRACTEPYLCLRGTGKTFEDAVRDMGRFDSSYLSLK
jgi:hypothetical protein